MGLTFGWHAGAVPAARSIDLDRRFAQAAASVRGRRRGPAPIVVVVTLLVAAPVAAAWAAEAVAAPHPRLSVVPVTTVGVAGSKLERRLLRLSAPGTYRGLDVTIMVTDFGRRS